MTQAFTTQQHVGTDGVLHLDVPAEWCDTDVEVVVKPVAMPANARQRLAAFQEILDNPVVGAPLLSDEDMSRERLYAERG